MKNIIKLFLVLILCFRISPVFPATAVELMNEGRMNLYKGNIDEGIKLLEDANSIDKESPYIKLLLAKGYSWNNEWDKSKTLYKEVINSTALTDQSHWEGKFGFAQVTSWEKKYDEALVLYQEILGSYKKISASFRLDVNLAIGDIYSWKMENNKAIEHFNQLLVLYPNNIQILNRIAKIYLWKGDYQISREYTAKVLSVDSKDYESAQRKRVLDQIKTFSATLGYDYTYYDSENNKGEKINVHNAMLGLNWQYSVPFKIFTYLTNVTQNSIESVDWEKAADWNYDVNIRGGGIYRINPLTFISVAADYTYDAKIFPDFSSEISLSRKLTPNIDLVGLYKFTYDKLDTIQTVKSKKYNLVSPGLIFYYNPEIYNRLQFYVESDFKDLFYSVLMHQHLALNPENIFQFYVFLSQGRSYLTFSDTSVLQKVTTYSVSFTYTHYFTSSWGIEFATGLTTRVNSYNNYHAGISGIYKW